MAKKKKRGGQRGGQPNRMTSADRTRARMRAQEKAEAERREREATAAEAPESVPSAPAASSPERAAEETTERTDEPRRGRPQAYPGEAKLRRVQDKLEKQAAAWDSNPVVNRIVCAVIDFFAGGIMILAPSVLTYYYLSGSSNMGTLSDFTTIGQPAWLAVLLALVGLMLGVFYYVVVPWKVWPGQTLGKHLGGIRIARRNQRELGLGTLLVRQAVGIMLLELWFSCDCLLLPQLITLVTGSADAGMALQSAGMAISVVSIVLFVASKGRLALHDRLAGTRVVRA